MRRRSAFTLLELVLVLALFTVLLVAVAPGLNRARDMLAARAAREELVAALAATRAHAVLSGGAQLVLTRAGDLRIERSDGVLLRDPIQLDVRYGATIEAEQNLPLVLRYDALGIGRMTSTMLRIRRGDVVFTVTVSAYGRARS